VTIGGNLKHHGIAHGKTTSRKSGKRLATRQKVARTGADVKTESGVVLEFQHSFYRKMVWVVDGLRRERDQKHFFMSINGRSLLKPKPLTYSVSSNESALLRDWMDSRVPVYFDFEDGTLWRLEPRSPEGKAHLSPVTKASFLNHYLRGKGLKGVNYLSVLARIQQAARARPLPGFQLYLANQRARQPRF
jgi:hypothetical protein